MTTLQQNNETNPSSTEASQVTLALLARLDRTDRALRRWRLAAQLCAGAILFGAGIAAGSAQSGKDASQQKPGQTSASPAKSTPSAPDAQDAPATGGAGGAAASPQAASPAAQAQGAARAGSRMVGIALDLNPSGRWNSTLLAVDEDGIVYALNTAGPKPMWQRFTYSP